MLSIDPQGAHLSHPSDGFTGILHPEVRAWLGSLAVEEDPLVAALESYGRERGFPMVGRLSGRWCELLARMVGARRVFEFGSGYGYSAFFFARAVGPEGEVIGSEKDQHELDAHARLFAGHPLKARIDLRLGSAFEIFDATEGDFDVVFIDIHKAGYLQALEAAVPRLRPGGLLLADNVLWGGKVAREVEPGDESTATLQAFTRALYARPQLQPMILPVEDGLAVALKL